MFRSALFAPPKAFGCKAMMVCLVIHQARYAVAAGPAPSTASMSSSVSRPTADHPAPASHRYDEIWIVSCRGVGAIGSTPNLNQLVYGRHLSNRGWTPSNRDVFSATGSRTIATIVFVPGDGYSHAQARDLGMNAYRRMIAGLPSEGAIRFVIWSWPSDQVTRRRVRDVRIKAGRTPWVAWCLSHWLDTVERGGPTCLVGTSLGARIVGEALHLRGGGRLGGYQLAAGQPALAGAGRADLRGHRP